jgi:putative peptide zinc metalloprotease protein
VSARADTPVLEPGSRVVRQVENGQVRFIVRAGATGKYLRVGEAEDVLLSLFDGERTLDKIRTSYMARRKERIENADIAAFVGRMRSLGVVRPTIEARNRLLLEKARQRREERHISEKFGSLLFMRRKLFDPDPLLNALVGPLRFLFTRAFVIFSCVLFLAAASILVARWDEVASGIANMGLMLGGGTGVSLGLIWVTALCVVFLHEFGHGLTCKHFGGEVHDMGVLLMFFQPCFYANVNDAWTFESRAARLWVTAAGGFIESVLGSLCVLLWAVTEPGTTVNGLAQVVFTISLSSTLLFNMNPLIKLDGYYLLADFLGIENLRDRSTAHVTWLFRNRILGLPAPRVTEDVREGRILATYAILSTAYMGMLLLVIVTVLVGALSGGGGPGLFVILVMGTLAWMLLKGPIVSLGGVMKELVRTHGATLRSPRFLAGAAVAVVAIVGIAAVVPWTRTSRAKSVLEPGRIVDVVAPTTGIVGAIHPKEGAAVDVGTPLFRMDTGPGEMEVALAREQAARLERDVVRRQSAGDSAGAAVARKHAEAATRRVEDAARRLALKEVVSPIAGLVLDGRVGERAGTPVSRDQVVMRVGDCTVLHARVHFDGRSAARIRAGMDARVRLRSFPGRTFEGKVLTVSGEAIRPKETDAGPAPTSMARWDVVIEIPNEDGTLRPGMSGEATVNLDRVSMLVATWDAVRQTFRADVF